jgi:hypothetical protein
MKKALFRDVLGNESCLESEVLPNRVQLRGKNFLKKIFLSAMFFAFLLWAEPKLYIFTLCLLGVWIEPTRGIIYSGTSNKKVSKK